MRRTWSWDRILAAAGRAAIVAALLGAAPRPAPADEAAPPDLTDLSLDELLDIDVVYGASRYEQKATHAPAAVDIVTAAEIREFGYRTLAEILSGVQGFYTTYDRNYSYVGVRGFQRPGDFNMRTLLLVDGHRINDGIYNMALLGTEGAVDVANIERVEVIRGPGSSLYGAGAFFAIINVVTRGGGAVGGVEVSASGGSYDTAGARVAWGSRLDNGAEVLLSGTTLVSGGQDLYYPEYDAPASNEGMAVGTDDDRVHNGFAKVSYRGLTLEVGHTDRLKEIPTGVYETIFNDAANRTLDVRDYVDLRLSRALPGGAGVTARLYHDRYYYRGEYNYGPPLFAPPDNLYVERAWASTLGTEIQTTWRAGPRHTLMAGGEYRDHYQQDYYADDDLGTYFDFQRDDSDWGVFVQDEFALSPRLAISAGLRHDRYGTFGGSTNPRLAVIWTPTSRTALKLLNGGAFRAPSAYELYYGAPANPALEPEKIRTHEIVLEQYFRKNTRFSASLFGNHIADLINVDTSIPLFENIGVVNSRGVEVEVERRTARGLSVQANYAFQDTRNGADDRRLDNSPTHLAKLRAVLPLRAPRLSLAAALRYTGGRTTLLGNRVDDFTVVDVTLLGKQVVGGLELSAGVYNLFGTRFFDPGSRGHLQDRIEQDGRSFRIRLDWKF